MKILLKWESKTNGRVERTRDFYPNDVIGTVHRVTVGRMKGDLVADLQIDHTVIRLADNTATKLKTKIQNWVNSYYDQMVTVYSIFDRKKEKPIQIRRGDRGGVCDPSTERHHSM